MKAAYIIPECNLPELEARIEKLNKRAKRLGVDPIVVTKTFDHVKARVCVLTVNGEINSRVWMTPEKLAEAIAAKKWPHSDTGERMAWWKIEVEGSAPTLTDWEFVAVLEPMPTDDGTSLNMMRCLPGASCPPEYRDVIGRCDHCKMHRKRNETFVVRHKDGSHKCVGRQCVKDFLNYHKDPHTLAEWATSLAELGSLCESASDEEWMGGGSYVPDSWDLKVFLTWTASRIEKAGWLSKGKAYEMDRLGDATAVVVLNFFTPPPALCSEEAKREWREYKEAHTPNDKNAEDAENAIEWARAISETEIASNNYLANVNLVARTNMATRKSAGIAASILPAYYKNVEREIALAQKAEKPESKHIGTVGERVKMMKVTCEKLSGFEGAYGFSTIHKMVDENGSDMTWFASGDGSEMKEGETYHVALTIKKHDEYKGRKVTMVNRVKVLSEDEIAKELKKAERAAKKLAKV